MKNIYQLVLFIIIVFNCSESFSQTPFTAGNLVVYRVGDGTDTLSSAAFPVNLDEYSTSGTLVRSHPLPVVVSGSNHIMTASGSATSEGMISRSVDKKFLLATGYDTLPDPTKLGVSGSTSASVNRVVGIMDANGVLDATTALNDAYSKNNFRGAVSTNGTDLWLSGTGSPSSSAGVRFTTKGATTSTQLSSTVTTNRNLGIFNNQLYSTSASGAFQGLCTVGTGLPTTSGQTIAILPGFPTTSGPSSYGFSVKPTTGDIAYVGDANSHPTGGVQKWTYNGTTWTLAYTLDSGLTSGTRAIAVDWSGTNPIIYAITSGSSRNKLVKVIDNNDSTAQFTILDSAGVNYIFRGLCFAPEAAAVTYTFNGNGNWDVPSNWLNNAIPPANLPSGAEIIIDPLVTGECILNITQTVLAGGKLTVMTGKKFRIPGNLTIQ